MPRRGAAQCLSLMVSFLIRAAALLASYVFLAGMLILLISDPIMRYLLGRPFYWSNEVSTFLMIEMAFAGFAITLAKGRHMRLTLFFNKAPRKIQNVLWVIISLVTTFYVSLVIYAVTRLAFSSLIFGCVTSTAELPFFPWQIVAAIGLLVFLMALVMFTVKRMAIALALKEESKEDEGLIDLGHGI